MPHTLRTLDALESCIMRLPDMAHRAVIRATLELGRQGKTRAVADFNGYWEIRRDLTVYKIIYSDLNGRLKAACN